MNRLSTSPSMMLLSRQPRLQPLPNRLFCTIPSVPFIFWLSRGTLFIRPHYPSPSTLPSARLLVFVTSRYSFSHPIFFSISSLSSRDRIQPDFFQFVSSLYAFHRPHLLLYSIGLSLTPRHSSRSKQYHSIRYTTLWIFSYSLPTGKSTIKEAACVTFSLSLSSTVSKITFVRARGALKKTVLGNKTWLFLQLLLRQRLRIHLPGCRCLLWV